MLQIEKVTKTIPYTLRILHFITLYYSLCIYEDYLLDYFVFKDNNAHTWDQSKGWKQSQKEGLHDSSKIKAEGKKYS